MADSACIPNIGRRQRNRRIMMGIVVAALTAGVAAWLLAAGVPRPWRLVVFLPAWVAALDFLQVRAKTCVLLAARGLRNMDDGDEAIVSASELIVVRTQARAVHVQSALAAAAITAIVTLA